MATSYYSGQGRFYVGPRDATTGKPTGLVEMGNVPSLTIDIETTKFEHKESETGSRAVDVTVIQEKKGTFTMTLEEINPYNLAIALFGTQSAVPTAPIVDEDVILTKGQRSPLKYPNAGSVSITGLVLDTDYTVDAINGTIVALAASPTIVNGTTYQVSYTPAAGTTETDAFINTSAERFLRFEGLNTIAAQDNGTNVVVDIFKASFDPLTGYELINEEIGSIELTGSILLDALVTDGGGQFFRQYNL